MSDDLQHPLLSRAMNRDWPPSFRFKFGCCCEPTCGNLCLCETNVGACLTIEDPPAASVCGENEVLEATLAALLSSKLVYVAPEEGAVCRFWSIKCVQDPVVEELTQGYAMRLQRIGGSCRFILTFWYSCGAVDCCNETHELSAEWKLAATYEYAIPPDYVPANCGEGPSFVFSRTFEESDTCADCDAAPDIDWPATLTLVSESGCTDEVDRGEECAPPPPPTSCCGVDVNPNDTEYLVTIESDCPTLDGITFILKHAFASIWWNSWNYPTSLQLPGTLCAPVDGDTCLMSVSLSCGENDPGTGDWNVFTAINCSPSSNFCDLDDGLGGPSQTHNGPIAGTCDPLNLTFERTIYPHGAGCAGCAPCTYFLTFTLIP